jgi:hypothetical protein
MSTRPTALEMGCAHLAPCVRWRVGERESAQTFPIRTRGCNLPEAFLVSFGEHELNSPVVTKGRAYPRAPPDARLNRAPGPHTAVWRSPILCSLTPPTDSVESAAPACTSASDVSFVYAPGARIVADPSSIRSWQVEERRAHSHATPGPTIRFRQSRCSDWKILRSLGAASAVAATVPVACALPET